MFLERAEFNPLRMRKHYSVIIKSYKLSKSTTRGEYMRIAIWTLFGLLSATAKATETNFAAWTAVILQGKVSDHWGWYFESQSRINDGWEFGSGNSPDALKTKGNRLLIRPAVRYLPHGDGTLQFHFGYAWTPNLSPERQEHRIYQQALLQEDGSEWWLAQRLRFEQRWIEGATGTALRVRYFARLQRYFSSDKKIGFALWDEAFWALNSIDNGPTSGFDQNRLFIGPHFLLNPQSRFELGYLNVFNARGKSTDSIANQALALYVYLDW